MAEWVYPHGSVRQDEWSVSLGASDSRIFAPGWRHTGLRVATLAPQGRVHLPAADEERLIVPLSGSFNVSLTESSSGNTTRYLLRGRDHVFAGRTDVLYGGTRTSVTIDSTAGGKLAVACAPTRISFPIQLIRAEDIPLELRGSGSCSRQIHNIGFTTVLKADRLLVCEVLTPAGNWSSYPPHKHDTMGLEETALEELYYFESQACSGAPEVNEPVGYQRVFASDHRPIDVTTEVSSGDVVLVPYGWHGPAMAAPGYDLYYLNVMAGPIREWRIQDHPAHAWVRETWRQQEIHPRLPFGPE